MPAACAAAGTICSRSFPAARRCRLFRPGRIRPILCSWISTAAATRNRRSAPPPSSSWTRAPTSFARWRVSRISTSTRAAANARRAARAWAGCGACSTAWPRAARRSAKSTCSGRSPHRSKATPSAPSATAPLGRCRACSGTSAPRSSGASTNTPPMRTLNVSPRRRSECEMTKLVVDGKEIEVPPEYTLLQACEAAGAEIPRFCYQERLSIAGNCRMCLIELVGSPKPVASCAWGVRDCRPGPKGEPPEVKTRSPMVRKAREGVMEFLLINHPLDCPICDQGGECDLQDQAMAYGVDQSRFAENKRAVEEKYIGALVKTVMTRCIHCTRCIRFATEVAGVPELGAIGRGEDMEITTYLETAMTSELQGNVVDLCPVGALTSKPYAFAARPWELNKTESIDVMDALGSAIRVDTRGREVMRILPRINDDVNEEWISDKTRHVVDGLRAQRLDQPYIRERGRLRPASWPAAFAAIAAAVARTGAKRIGAVVGDLAAAEEIFALKDLMGRLEVSNIDCRQDGAALDPAWGRASYLFNPTIAGIERADRLLIVGADPRREAALLNARIRKRWRSGNFPIALIGQQVDLTYTYDYLGAGPDTLAQLAAGRHAFADILKKAAHPLILLGSGALARPDGAAVAALAAKAAVELGAVKEGWNGYGFLPAGGGPPGGARPRLRARPRRLVRHRHGEIRRA